MPKSILFVCLGNICRSPLSEGIAKDFAKKYHLDIVIDSAGTGNWHINEPPCSGSQQVAKMNNIDISSFRGRQVNPFDKQRFDLIIALDQSNYNDLKRLGFKDVKKLGSYGYNNQDVPDPYFFDGFEGFENVFEMIQKCVKNLFEVEFDIM